MSFITKRERVFNDYDQFELPARNEGKLKTYSSCTDTRAWSHFYSDKSEHLVDIIKRNNQTCRAKYVPTDVIVNTLMAAKNAEISRLKRRVEEFEQMVAAYDQLELTCEQKCEIANAHAAIKQANKELDDLFINLDMSNYTEGLDSERYDTVSSGAGGPGKGDEWQNFRRDEENQCSPMQSMYRHYQDSSTNAVDPRIEELQDALVRKDAKLNALQNVKAILENEVCEPYCIYAHIYTALEKIFAILSQNGKYKIYLGVMESGRNTCDIKGKILHKLDVLEKFNISLISQGSNELDLPQQTCPPVLSERSVYYCSESFQRMETISELTPRDSKNDKKRAKLVANIMDEEEIEVLSQENPKHRDSINNLDIISDYNIENENLKRLKNLQLSYDELVSCYESVKHDRDNLQLKCNRYNELEQECINLKNQLQEYNALWKEKEHYRQRSEDLHNLKEQYLILAEETSNIETQLKAETEISQMRCNTIEELRKNNLNLEKTLNDMTVAYNKEKNTLLCKLKEMECLIMCQEQQIKSLSSQIDMLIEQERKNVSQEENITKTFALMEEVETLKEQINDFKSVLFCSDEEKLKLQQQLCNNNKIIEDLKTEVENWKCSYEKVVEQNTNLERHSDDYINQIQALVDENTQYKNEIEMKRVSIEGLKNIIADKSQKIVNLINDITTVKKENLDLVKEIEDMQKARNDNIDEQQNENQQTLESLQFESYDTHRTPQNDEQEDSNLGKNSEYDLKEIISAKDVQIEELLNELKSQHTQNEYLLRQITMLKEENQVCAKDVESLKEDKSKLEEQLKHKTDDLDGALKILELTKVKSNELLSKMQQSDCLKSEYFQLKETYNKSLSEKLVVQKELRHVKKQLNDKITELSNANKMLAEAKTYDKILKNTSHQLNALEAEVNQLNISHKNLQEERAKLQQQYDQKNYELNHLQEVIEEKNEENTALKQQIQCHKQKMDALESELVNNKAYINTILQQTNVLTEKVKDYESLALDFNKLSEDHCKVKCEKDELQKELYKYLEDLKYLDQEKANLESFKNSFQLIQDFGMRVHLNSQLQISENQTRGFPYTQISQEIEAMRNEKQQNTKRIQDLQGKLEESEKIVASLTEDLLAREGKIGVLENHTNALEYEIRRLHNDLETMLNTGEQMKDNYRHINETLEKVECRHKQAMNNIKEELKRLQDDNAKLENQLSIANMKADESCKKYTSQVTQLQQEKEIIVDSIKQLHYEVTGDSTLSHDYYSIEIVIQILDKLKKFINLKNVKNATLEQTIHTIQTSSQLLIAKADEAKKLVEKEKQKVIAEKEEAIAARTEMETQLNSLRKQLKEQTLDNCIIRDLEAEIMNQKLIIEKINKSKSTYISKLLNETNNMQNLYQNALAKIGELEVENQEYLIEKSQYIELIKNLNQDLESKKDEAIKLNKYIKEIKSSLDRHPDGQEVAIQTHHMSSEPSNMSSQTERYKHPRDITNTEIQTVMQENSQSVKKDEHVNINVMKINHPPKEKIQPVTDLLPMKRPTTNEVQILAIAVEPAFDFVRNSYLNYKFNRLSLGHLEQYSITCVAESSETEIFSNHLLEQDFIDTPFVLHFPYNHSDELKEPSVNNSSQSLVLSRFTNNLFESSQLITAESVCEEDMLAIYQGIENSLICKDSNNIIGETSNSKQWNEKALHIKPESECHYQKNSDDVLVSTSLAESTASEERVHSDLESLSLHSKGLKQENMLQSGVTPKDKQKFNFEQSNLKSARCFLSRNETDLILIENHNEIELDKDNNMNKNVKEKLKIVNQRQEIILQKCKSVNVMSSAFCSDQAILVKIDATHDFENKIQTLTTALENIEKDYKRKIKCLKAQYDASIKKIINEHNQGVQCLQNLHEDTMKDMKKKHENEIDTLRTMSLEAMQKAEKLQQENLALKNKLDYSKVYVDEKPVKMSNTKAWRRRDPSFLSKTKVESFNVKPKTKIRTPCECCATSTFSNSTGGSSLKFNDNEKIRQVERTLLFEIARKIMNGSNIENLEKQELMYLHSKVCRHWKKKLEKNESQSLNIEDLKSEGTDKQQDTVGNSAEQNRKQAEERLLQEASDTLKLRTIPQESDDFQDDKHTYPEKSKTNNDEFKTSLDLESRSHYSRPASATANALGTKRGKDAKNTVESGETPTRLRRPTPKPGKKWGDKK